MKPRFERSDSKWKWTTKRDLDIVEFVYYARYATRFQVQEALFAPTTASSCKTRLRMLFDRGYLRKRPTREFERDIYCLGLRGRHHIASKGLAQDYVDKVAGEGTTARLPNMFMEHDLTLASIYAKLRIQCQLQGLDCEWKNSRMLELELAHLNIQPDAWLQVSRNGKSKSAFVEFTRVAPTADEMQRKLDAYARLLPHTPSPVLWLSAKQATKERLMRLAHGHAASGYLLFATVEAKDSGLVVPSRFLTAPIWDTGDHKSVSFIRLA